MGDLGENSNLNPRILVSRNSPVAFVVGGAGFIGSHIVDALLEKGVQVVCLDNFITGNKKNLESATRNKRFHLINQSIESFQDLSLPRLDYAFFAANMPATTMLSGERASLFSDGVITFLSLLKEYRSKICFISSVELYDNKVPTKLEELKRAEIRFAKFAKEHKLNARVVRLAPLYGPRMHFLSDDPTTRLIQASLSDELQKEQTSLDFSSRALYVEDAVDLLLKSVFSGGTSQKIYDGALLNPIKVSDLKQVLLDPMWYEKRGFTPAEIPPWPTPNLKKTIKELAWKPRTGLVKALKETVSYFKENPADVPKLSQERFEKDVKLWLQNEPPVAQKTSQSTKEAFSSEQSGVVRSESQEKSKPKKERGRRVKGVLRQLPVFLGIVLILYAIVYPLTTLIIGAFSVRAHLENASSKIEAGDFDGAQREIGLAKFSLDQLSAIPKSFILLERLPQTKNQLGEYQTLLQVVGEGVDGASHAAAGAKSLFQITDIVSGADTSNPKPLFDNAQLEFSTADTELSDVIAKLGDESFTDNLPSFVGAKTDDFKQKLSFYSGLVEKGRAAANFLK